MGSVGGKSVCGYIRANGAGRFAPGGQLRHGAPVSTSHHARNFNESRTLPPVWLSAGSWIAAAAFERTALRASEFLRAGASEPLAKGSMPYAEINALMTDRRE